MKFNIITLFPEMYPSILSLGVTGKALKSGSCIIETINPRDFATDAHKTVDDTPYGGGAGMLLKPDVLGKACDYIIETQGSLGIALYMSPRGALLNQSLVEKLVANNKPLAANNPITILCGRYEGVDQRLLDYYNFFEVSIGDYILSGGEIASFVLIDACIRKLDGVLGNAQTHDEESFSLPESPHLLEYPHYTRPDIWQGLSVPEVLKSGNHKKISDWRLEQAKLVTQKNRSDLWS